MKTLTLKQLRKKFKKMYLDEFEDPNESLKEIIDKGNKYYYSLFYKYK